MEGYALLALIVGGVVAVVVVCVGLAIASED